MTKQDARALGFKEGYSAGQYCIVEPDDRRESDCTCFRIIGKQVCVECLTYTAFESEQNARQYSPWEFIASAINGCGGRADGLWDAYDAGVAAGIKKAVRKRLAKVAA